MLTSNPELYIHHINFREFALKPSLQNLHDGSKLKTKVSNHEIIRIPYQSEEFALKPSLQNLHAGNKLKIKVWT